MKAAVSAEEEGDPGSEVEEVLRKDDSIEYVGDFFEKEKLAYRSRAWYDVGRKEFERLLREGT